MARGAATVIGVEPVVDVRDPPVSAVELWTETRARRICFYALCVISCGILPLLVHWFPLLGFRLRCRRERSGSILAATHVRVVEGGSLVGYLAPLERVPLEASEFLLLLHHDDDRGAAALHYRPSDTNSEESTADAAEGAAEGNGCCTPSGDESTSSQRSQRSSVLSEFAVGETPRRPLLPDTSAVKAEANGGARLEDSDATLSATAFIFEHRHLRYAFHPWSGKFRRLEFPFAGVRGKDALRLFASRSLDETQWAGRRLAFGPAVAELTPEPLLTLALREIFHPFYVFQAAALALWLWDEYYQYAGAVAAITVFSLCAELYNLRSAQLRLWLIGGLVDKEIFVRRGPLDAWTPTPSRALAPGCLVRIENGHRLPCDVLLLGGICTVDESTLTGESTAVAKEQCGGSEFVNLQNLLQGGTTVLQSRNGWGVCVRTGFSTAHGELLRALACPPAKREKFIRDSLCFLSVLVALGFVGFALSLIFTLEHGLTSDVVVIRALDTFSNAVPPALPATMTVGSSISVAKLFSRWRVSCVLPRAVNIAGRCRTIVLDKTGTLTTKGLELDSILRVRRASTGPLFEPLLIAPDSRAGGPGLDGSDDSVPFLELFAAAAGCCQALSHLDGGAVGDPLDLALFNAVGARFASEDAAEVRVGSRVWRVHRRFDFEPHLQRMTVLASPKDRSNELYVFSKGSPEVLLGFCVPDSVPRSYEQQVTEQTARGRRVLVICARRAAAADAVDASREEAERGLIPLGLLLFRNPLKPGVDAVVRELQEAEVTCLMATGDAPLTAFAVAGEAGLRKEGSVALCLDWRDQQLCCSVLQKDHQEQRSMVSVQSMADLSGKDPRKLNLIVTGPAFEALLYLHHANELSYAPAWDGTPLPPPAKDPKLPPTPTLRKVVDASCWAARPMRVCLDCDEDDHAAAAVRVVEVATGSQDGGDDDDDDCERAAHNAFGTCGGSARVVDMSLLEYVLRHGKVFARMSPQHKACLVQALQELPWNPVVMMCGDGANDCAAMRQADLSLSVGGEAGSSAAATFAAAGVEALPCILLEGRGALCNSFQQFKFVALYALVQLFSTLTLYYFGGNLTDPQYLWVDLVVALPCSMTSAWTAASERLSSALPDKDLVGRAVLTGVLGQIAVQLVFLALTLALLLKAGFYVPFVPQEDLDRFGSEDLMCYENTVIFIVTNFQYIAMSFALSFSTPWRKPPWHNGFYSLVFGVLVVFSVAGFLFPEMPPTAWLVNWLTIMELPGWFRAALTALVAANAAITCAFEWLVVQKIARKRDMPGLAIDTVVLPPSAARRRCAFVA